MAPTSHQEYEGMGISDIELLSSPMASKFWATIETINSSCLICSPYITTGPVRHFLKVAYRKGIENSLTLKVITDISPCNVLSGATDLGALLALSQEIQHTQIVYLPRIHAKVYVCGDSAAIISSANFTDSGLFGNLEYGVRVVNPHVIRTIRDDVEQYAKLGAPISRFRLESLRDSIEQLRAAVQREQKSISRKLQSVSAELQKSAEEELIRLRVHGRTVNAIFSQTILYLLSRREMTTEELHGYVREIHPDLCDDTFDRVIDGEHFGKLWKHQVRNAQQYLKRSGLVAYNRRTQTWMRTGEVLLEDAVG